MMLFAWKYNCWYRPIIHRRKLLIPFILILFFFCFYFAETLISGLFLFGHNAIANTERKPCALIRVSKNRTLLNKSDFKKKLFQLSPICNNLLNNLTNGIWKWNKDTTIDQISLLQEIETKFQKTIGMPAVKWRQDGKCGFNEHLEGYSFPSICNPNGLSCCTDFENGICVEGSSWTCLCQRCFDSAKLVYPLLSQWVVSDERCLWKNYTASEACFLLNNAFNRTRFKKLNLPHFHFFGDSLVHNMYLGLLILLSGRKNSGTWKRCLPEHLKKLCYGPNQLYYMSCLVEATSSNLDEVDDGLMCEEETRAFNVTFKSYFAASFKDEMLSYVQSLVNTPGTVVTFGIGVLERFDTEVVLKDYLKPVVELVKSSNTGWPKLLWVHPLRMGPLVSRKFWDGSHNEEADLFIEKLNRYLVQEKISSFDFRKLTTNVHSHDGTHYGIGLNLMKVQIWLNYVASNFLS